MGGGGGGGYTQYSSAYDGGHADTHRAILQHMAAHYSSWHGGQVCQLIVIASPTMNIGSHNHLYTFEKEGAWFSCIVARLEEWQAYSRKTCEFMIN